jgi:hypothetical protein
VPQSRDHLGRFASPAPLSELQIEALDREFDRTLREAALGARPSTPAPWSSARTSPRPARGFDWGGGSRLPSTPTRGSFDEAVRKAAREVGPHELRIGA